ncbi:MAG: hypothetical protein M1816_003164 [Peltula sp. TS41687]|nr:MAG: hypothetical protein M1816_003164 [Peltula sp. TS41687]
MFKARTKLDEAGVGCLGPAKKRRTSQPLSPTSLQAAPKSDAGASRGPASSTPTSQSLFASVSQQTTPPQVPNANSKRLRPPSYRDELQNHSVHIELYGRSMPTPVRAHGQNMLNRQRTSPGLTDTEVDQILEKLSTLDNADEERIRETIVSTSLVSREWDYKNEIATASNLSFDRTALPYTPGSQYPPVVTPVPDFHVGYPHESFVAPQTRLTEVMEHPRLRSYAKPTPSGYWPFFAIEYRSQSLGGSQWVAENQNAGTGAHCVNSVETLSSYTNTTELRRIADSMVFSCVVNSDNASIWVHWRECGDDRRIVSSEAEHYPWTFWRRSWH